MGTPQTFEIGHVIRTRDGRGRIVYRPDWSPSKPWASYHSGTAHGHYATIGEARRDFDLETDAERAARLAAINGTPETES